MTDTQVQWIELWRNGSELFGKLERGFWTEAKEERYIQWKRELIVFAARKLKHHELYPELEILLREKRTVESFREIVKLLAFIGRDDEFFSAPPEAPIQAPAVRHAPPPLPPIHSGAGNDRDIFIVHGHDEEARKDTDLFLRRQNLNPIILMEQPSAGKTIIEKLEAYTDVGYGIVLYTPCDQTAEGNRRARQNVVLEHGYLMGRLGRDRVFALVKGDIELPGDYKGVVYIAMNPNNDWKVELVKELKKAGCPADANRI